MRAGQCFLGGQIGLGEEAAIRFALMRNLQITRHDLLGGNALHRRDHTIDRAVFYVC